MAADIPENLLTEARVVRTAAIRTRIGCISTIGRRSLRRSRIHPGSGDSSTRITDRATIVDRTFEKHRGVVEGVSIGRWLPTAQPVGVFAGV